MLIKAGKHMVNPDRVLMIGDASYSNADQNKIEGVRHGLEVMFEGGKRLSWGTSESTESFAERVTRSKEREQGY